jgi:hypothetical protein
MRDEPRWYHLTALPVRNWQSGNVSTADTGPPAWIANKDGPEECDFGAFFVCDLEVKLRRPGATLVALSQGTSCTQVRQKE